MGWGLQMWDHDQVEAGGTGGERTHLRQKEGGRSLLRTPGGGGTGEQRGSLLGSSGWGLLLKGGGKRVWRRMEFSLFGNCASL